MMIDVISENLAIDFLKKHKANKERISITGADIWYGAFCDELLVGVISLKKIGKNNRVKAFYVSKDYRKVGAGMSLLTKALTYDNMKYTAFATNYSRNLFLRCGFEEKWFNELKKISFLVKE